MCGIDDPGLPAYSSSGGNTGDDGGDDGSDDGDSDDNGYREEDLQLCDYTRKFDTLDDLSAATDVLRSDCIDFYALQTLITMLDAAYGNYTSVNDGYDEEFGYYVTYIEKLVPSVLDNSFMFDEAHATTTGNIPPAGPGMQCMQSY
jgi:chitinase